MEVLLAQNSYNEVGQLKGKSLQDGLQNTSYAYNERGWLKKSSSPQFNGNISSQQWGSGISLGSTFNYSYDKLDRLTSGVSTGMSETVSYDVMGNIKSLNRDGQVRSHTYRGNQLNKAMAGAETGSYTYDGNGNAITDGRTGVALSYNDLNLPKTATKELRAPPQ